MKTNIKFASGNTLDKLMKYLGILMAFVYVGVGVVMIMFVHEVLVISKVHAYALSIIFIAFGMYRGYRVYQQYYRSEDEG